MIRAAHEEDLHTLESIELSSFGPDAWSAGQLRAELGANRVALVDVDEFGVRGWASFQVLGDEAELLRIAVGLGSRGRGIGTNLLGAGLEAVRERGVRRVLLEVAADNVSAIALYERFGFTRIHTRRHYYATGQDALVYALDLAP